MICDTCILFFNANGEQTGRYDYGGMTLSSFSQNNEYSLIVLAENSVNGKNTVVLLNSEGRSVYSSSINTQIKDVSVSDDYSLYLLTNDEIIRISPEFVSEKLEYTSGADTIIALDGYALAISETQAESVFTAAQDGK